MSSISLLYFNFENSQKIEPLTILMEKFFGAPLEQPPPLRTRQTHIFILMCVQGTAWCANWLVPLSSTLMSPGCRTNTKKSAKIEAWEQCQGCTERYFSIWIVKAWYFIDFQISHMNEILISYDRTWHFEQLLFNKLFPKFPSLSRTSALSLNFSFIYL